MSYDIEHNTMRLTRIFTKADMVRACIRVGLSEEGSVFDLARRLSEYGATSTYFDFDVHSQELRRKLRYESSLHFMAVVFYADSLKEACRYLDVTIGYDKAEHSWHLDHVNVDHREERESATRPQVTAASTQKSALIGSKADEIENSGVPEEGPEEDLEHIKSSDIGEQSRWEIDGSVLGHASPGLLDPQREALDRLKNWWAGGFTSRHAGVVVLPTGAGKTRLGVSFALRTVVQFGGRVLWLAPKTELVQGALSTFIECGGESDRPFVLSRFEGAKLRDELPGDVVVASLPSLAYRRDGIDNLETFFETWRASGPCLVVFDECHHIGAKTWTRVLEDFIAKLESEGEYVRLLGLSATPTRTDENERRDYWRRVGHVIYEVGVKKLIDMKILADPDLDFSPVLGVEIEAEASEIAYYETWRDFSPSLTHRIVGPRFTEAVVRKYLDSPEKWGQVLVFAGDQEHAKQLAKKFTDHHIGCRSVLSSAGDTSSERKKVIDRFRQKEFPVLVNVQICTEGVDIPNLDSVFIARPTKSRVLTQQMMGRAMRGRAVGGTEGCNVVFFHAKVKNLVDEVLNTSYVSEAEVYSTVVNFDVETETEDDAQREVLSTQGQVGPHRGHGDSVEDDDEEYNEWRTVVSIPPEECLQDEKEATSDCDESHELSRRVVDPEFLHEVNLAPAFHLGFSPVTGVGGWAAFLDERKPEQVVLLSENHRDMLLDELAEVLKEPQSGGSAQDAIARKLTRRLTTAGMEKSDASSLARHIANRWDLPKFFRLDKSGALGANEAKEILECPAATRLALLRILYENWYRYTYPEWEKFVTKIVILAG